MMSKEYKNKHGGFDLEGYLADLYKPFYAAKHKQEEAEKIQATKYEPIPTSHKEYGMNKAPEFFESSTVYAPYIPVQNSSTIHIEVLKNRIMDDMGIKIDKPKPYKGEILEIF